MIPPWTNLPCSICGDMHLATRSEPSEEDESICGDCEMYDRGYKDGAKSIGIASNYLQDVVIVIAKMLEKSYLDLSVADNNQDCALCSERISTIKELASKLGLSIKHGDYVLWL